MRIRASAALALAGFLLNGTAAMSAEINLHASAAIDAALKELLPRFEASTGHSIRSKLGIASNLRRDIEAGAAFDVCILVGDLEALARDGRIAAGTQTALGRSGYGLGVRQGAPKPSIATAEAFKRVMLGAASVGYTEGGGSGAYFVGLLGRLGIADAMKDRLRPGEGTQADVASGKIEMVVTGIVPILRSPGIELAAPLPPELQSYSTFWIGVAGASREPAAARALRDFLAGPEAAATFRKHGVEPAR